MTTNIALLLFILIFEGDKSEASPLTMGFGKTLHLDYNSDQFSARAFDFNIFPESGERFEDQYQYSKLIVLLLEGVNGDIKPFKEHLRRLHLLDHA